MTSYTQGSASISGFASDTLSSIELRVISNLLQQQNPSFQQDQLSTLRNDQATELGLTTPVPGN